MENSGRLQFKMAAVFCGSRTGKSPIFAAKAQELADEMVKRNIGLVYGGGTIGLMGIIANAVAKGTTNPVYPNDECFSVPCRISSNI